MKNNIFSSLKQYADLSKQIKEQRALVLRQQRLVRALGESFDSEVCASERAVADGEFLGHVSYAFNENLPCAFLLMVNRHVARWRVLFMFAIMNI